MSAAPHGDTAARQYHCSTCGKSYHRSSHLRRHEVTHSNEKSSQCPYCNRSFAKVEVARRHAKACAEKSNAAPPPEAKRGRKVRACDRCSQGKLSCDALIPSCSRCVSQNKPCTYERRRLLANDDDTITEDNNVTEANSIDEANAARPICMAPFLLSFTDTSKETTVDAFVQDAVYTTNEEAPHCHHTTPSAPRPPAPTALYTPSVWDTIADFDQQPPLPIGNIEDHLPPSSSHTLYTSLTLSPTALSTRTQEIRHALLTTHANLLSSSSSSPSSPSPTTPFFDPALETTVFTPANAKHFLWSYFHRCHPELPILHRAAGSAVDDDSVTTTTTTPLLLAVLVAEAFMYGRDVFVRDGYGCGGGGVRGSEGDGESERREDIQTLQAALIINVLQSGMNDRAARRRLKAQRHPLLVAKMRERGLLASRRRRRVRGAGPVAWRDFVEDEMRVRLATYAFMVDNHLCLFFAHPPQLCLSEMLCDLPCTEAVWDAKDAAEFERLNVESSFPSPSPKSLVSALLAPDDGPGASSTAPRWRPFDLYVAISALQSLVHTTRTSALGDATSTYTAILRATDRWERLWQSSSSSATAASGERHTFLRHADELCWLVRTVVEVAQRRKSGGDEEEMQVGGGGRRGGGGGGYGGGDGDEYMRRVSVDSFAELHAFIGKHAYV